MPRSPTAAVPSAVVDAMRSWGEEARATLRSRSSLVDAWLEQLRAFGRKALPRQALSLPVFYPFAGADLLTAAALFSQASRFVLLSQLDVGEPLCFVDAACRNASMHATLGVRGFAKPWSPSEPFMRMWQTQGFAWTQTTNMRRNFNTSWGGANTVPLGVLPVMLLSLSMLRARLKSVEVRPGPSGSRVLVLQSSTFQLNYVGCFSLTSESLSTELAELSSTLLGRDVATLVKAAEGARWLTASPEFADFVLSVSAAVVHDDTGLLPTAYEPTTKRKHKTSEWTVRTYGNYSAVAEGYKCLDMRPPWLCDRTVPPGGQRFMSRCPAGVPLAVLARQRDECMRAFNGSAHDLPFRFGYVPGASQVRADCWHQWRNASAAENVPTGVMLTAWRSSGAEPAG